MSAGPPADDVVTTGSPSETFTSSPANNAITISSTLLSGASQTAEGPQILQSQSLPALDDFSMLTLLLRLVTILKNGDGDASMHRFTEILAAERESVVSSGATVSNEGNPAILNSLSAIFAQCQEVVVANYLEGCSNRFVALHNWDETLDNAEPGAKDLKKFLIFANYSHLENFSHVHGSPFEAHSNFLNFQPNSSNSSPSQCEDVTLPHIIWSNPARFGRLRQTPMDSSSNFLAEWLTETFIPGNANSGLNVTGSPVSDRTEFHRNHLKTGGSSRSFLKLT